MIKRSTKSISFLMEFIIVLFFFALSSAVCVSIYASADKMNTKANDTKTALTIAQNYVESLDSTSEGLMIYDKDGNEVNTYTGSKDNVSGDYFKLEVFASAEDNVMEVKVMCEEEVLVTLQYADFTEVIYEK